MVLDKLLSPMRHSRHVCVVSFNFTLSLIAQVLQVFCNVFYINNLKCPGDSLAYYCIATGKIKITTFILNLQTPLVLTILLLIFNKCFQLPVDVSKTVK